MIDDFFSHILSLVYLHWDADVYIFCGDVNSRTGNKQDVDSAIDDVPDRHPIDVHSSPNQHGLTFFEFLNDAKLCMLNGRFDSTRDNFTYINNQGKSVVDYMCVPHDCLKYVSKIEVMTTRAVIDEFELSPLINDPKPTSDHSLLEAHVTLDNSLSNMNRDVKHTSNPGQNCTQTSDIRYKRCMPDDFLQSALSQSSINQVLGYFINHQGTQNSVDSIYEQFCTLYYEELTRLNLTICPNKSKASRYSKPWWCDELAILWSSVVAKDQELKHIHPRRKRRKKHHEIQLAQKAFDRAFKRHKRQYLRSKEAELEQVNTSDPNVLWKYLKTLGPRNSKGPPLEVYDDNNEVTFDIDFVLQTGLNNSKKNQVAHRATCW